MNNRQAKKIIAKESRRLGFPFAECVDHPKHFGQRRREMIRNMRKCYNYEMDGAMARHYGIGYMG